MTVLEQREIRSGGICAGLFTKQLEYVLDLRIWKEWNRRCLRMRKV